MSGENDDEDDEITVPINNVQALPPVYGSIQMQLYEIGQESSSVTDFLYIFYSSICTHCLVSTILFMCFIIASLMCYFGLVYVNKCPAKKEIPVYLLIEGSVGLLQVTLLMMRYRRERQEDLGEDTDLTGIGLNSSPQNHYSTNSSKITELIIWVFLFIWFIIGNIWVFQVFLPPGRQHERSSTPTYWCHSYTYNIALIQILLTHFVIAFMIISSLFLALCARRFMGMRHPQMAR